MLRGADRPKAVGLALVFLHLAAGCTGAPTSVEKTASDPPRAEAAERGAGARDPRPPVQEALSEADRALHELLASLGVEYVPSAGRIDVSGWVNMQRGLVEVFACTPEGKTHESVVVLDCVPSGVHAGLLALRLRPGTPVELGTEGEYRPPTGDPVEIRVRWTDAGGEAHSARAEDWIWDEKDARSMPHCAWIFAGSFLQPSASDPSGGTYAANLVKSIVTTYHDATSVLENPFAEGADDTVYYANERAVPPVGTPVTVSFRPVSEDAH